MTEIRESHQGKARGCRCIDGGLVAVEPLQTVHATVLHCVSIEVEETSLHRYVALHVEGNGRGKEDPNLRGLLHDLPHGVRHRENCGLQARRFV